MIVYFEAFNVLVSLNALSAKQQIKIDPIFCCLKNILWKIDIFGNSKFQNSLTHSHDLSASVCVCVCVCLYLVDVICVKYMSMAREFYTKKWLAIPVKHPSEKTRDSPTLTSGPLFGNVFPQISFPLGILRHTFIFIAYAYACRSIVHVYIWLRAPKLPLSYAQLSPIFFFYTLSSLDSLFFSDTVDLFSECMTSNIIDIEWSELSICNTFNSIDEKKMKKNGFVCEKRKKTRNE